MIRQLTNRITATTAAICWASCAQSTSVEEDITSSEYPAFAYACTLQANSALSSLYETVAVVFTGTDGWIVAFDKDDNETFLAHSNSRHLKPFEWDINGGVWLASRLEYFIRPKGGRLFSYHENLSKTLLIRSASRQEC